MLGADDLEHIAIAGLGRDVNRRFVREIDMLSSLLNHGKSETFITVADSPIQKRVSESDAASAELIARAREIKTYQIAEACGHRYERMKRSNWSAVQQRDAGLLSLRQNTLLPNLHDDRRWDVISRAMGLGDRQLR